MKVVWEQGGCAMVLMILIVDGTENSSRARFWSKTILLNHPLYDEDVNRWRTERRKLGQFVEMEVFERSSVVLCCLLRRLISVIFYTACVYTTRVKL